MDKISITQTESIAESFNKYFTYIGPKLAKDIDTSTKGFNEYIKKHDTTQPEKVKSENELKDTFFSLKTNKSAGYDDISFNVVELCGTQLIFLCKLVFFKIAQDLARVIPLFKDDKSMN